MPEIPELAGDAPLAIDSRAERSKAGKVLSPEAASIIEAGSLELSLEDAGTAAQAPPVVPAQPLPEIPLFSELPPDAFVALASRCTLRRFKPGEVVIAQGSVGESFFVLSSGKVRVYCAEAGEAEVPLAELGEGAFFGEMAVLSGTQRTASVAAIEESEALEIRSEVLAELKEQFPTFGLVLRRFCRQRLLSKVMATSAVFRPFAKSDRKALIERFRIREVPAGIVVVQEGAASDGLYVVMCGELAVTKMQCGTAVTLATLRAGDLFGEIALLTKSAATASVQSKRQCTLLRLPREAFDELISTHPQVLAFMSELSDERLRAQEALLAGKLACDENGLVLV